MQTYGMITKIVDVADLPAVGILPNRLGIEVLTSAGSMVLEMSVTAAVELGGCTPSAPPILFL